MGVYQWENERKNILAEINRVTLKKQTNNNRKAKLRDVLPVRKNITSRLGERATAPRGGSDVSVLQVIRGSAVPHVDMTYILG